MYLIFVSPFQLLKSAREMFSSALQRGSEQASRSAICSRLLIILSDGRGIFSEGEKVGNWVINCGNNYYY